MTFARTAGRVLGVMALVASLAGAASAELATISGKIAAVDAQQHLLRVKTGLLTTQEFQISPDTKVSDGQRELNVGSLSLGDEVHVQYMEVDGRRMARQITLEPANAAGAAAPEPSKQ